jgi:hypothetical protein
MLARVLLDTTFHESIERIYIVFVFMFIVITARRLLWVCANSSGDLLQPCRQNRLSSASKD